MLLPCYDFSFLLLEVIVTNYLLGLSSLCVGAYTGTKIQLCDIGLAGHTAANMTVGLAVDLAGHMLGITAYKTAFKIGMFASAAILNGYFGKWKKEGKIMNALKINEPPKNADEGIGAAGAVAVVGAGVLYRYEENLKETMIASAATYGVGPAISYAAGYIFT